MELIKDQIIEKYAKQYKHRMHNTLLPYEYDYTCIAWGYNVLKQKN